MEQAVVTVEYSQARHLDVALPVTIRTRLLADALAKGLHEPAKGNYYLALKTPDGMHRLPHNATFADLGLLSGMSLFLLGEDQAMDFPAGTGALLRTDQGDPLPLVGTKMIVGRSDAARGVFVEVDLSPFDLKKYTSRKHALIELKDGKYILQDNGSTNGTFANSKRLAAGEMVELKEGDVLEFGRAEKGGIRVTFFTRKK